MGVEFAGKGAQDVSISKEGTQPPTAGTEGTSGGVEFAGNGDADVKGFSSDTSQHDPSEHDFSQEGNGVNFVG